ncbi:ComEC/Rec2 family competence protein [Kitasatospora aureofaciens]|uniref:ComEC/Rec2 family competence protein n=1 Tax=Kitasatospora aureofaciens TaxID=1894 RepID=UPI0033DB890D
MTEALSEADNSVDQPWERLEAVVLDVGHGNSAVIRDGRRCLVVDVARECELLDELLQSGIKHIEHLVISHADVDHVRGALKLLPRDEISIGTVWFNPDGSKNTRLWKRFVHLVHTLYEAGKFKVFPSISVANSSDLSFGRVGVEILHPDILFAGLGPAPDGGLRSEDNNDPPITSNGMSVTLRVSLDGAPAVVFPGDLDAAGLDRVLLRGKPMDAPVLVFPHHGGHCGQTSASEFTERLCAAVAPELVVVSMGRTSYENPLPEVVRSIRQTLPGARLLCTQISRRCHTGSLPLQQDHLLDRPAHGRQSGSSCAGTVSVLGTADGLRVTPSRSGHREFIASLEAPMCMYTGAEIPHSRGEIDRSTLRNGSG